MYEPATLSVKGSPVSYRIDADCFICNDLCVIWHYQQDLSFNPQQMEKIMVRLHQAVGGNCPPDSCIVSFKSVGFPKRKAHRQGCFSFWRYRPDLNWGMRVLQTLALPLGHGTIYKNRTAERSYFILLERVTRLELATSTLARWRSTG